MLMPIITGCQLIRDEIDCAESDPYHFARELAPLKAPEGMTVPTQRADRRVPDIQTNAGAAIGRCLEKPPQVLSNETALALAESKKGKSKDAQKTIAHRPWPQIPETGWVSIDPLEGADLQAPLRPGMPAWQIHDVLQAWATAWSEQERDPYFAFYAGSFVPEQGKSWVEWRNMRLEKLVGEPNVDVSIYGAEAQVLGPESVAVRFTERYRSDVSTAVQRKQMLLVREGDVWSIKRERSAE